MTEKWGIGDPAKADSWGWTTIGDKDHGALEVLWGEHPHSTSDNKMYARSDDGHIFDFDGHRILIDVQLHSYNYLKESHLSGDQVRKGGECIILADRIPIYSFFFRDAQYALLRAHALIGELSEHSSGIMVKKEREKLPGRKIFYREKPAIIDRIILDQGCVIIKSADGNPFPPPVYADDGGDERESTIKDDILSKHIWWFRK